MAKISWLGATYTNVPAVSFPDGDGGQSVFYENSPGAVVVTEEPDTGGGTAVNITAVDISSDTVDAAHLLNGYTAHDRYGNSITGEYVAPPGSSWTKVGETTYQISTTSGSQTDYTTFETGYNNLFAEGKIVYIRIKDTAGKRSGYFFDSNNWYMPPAGATSFSAGVRNYRMYNGSNFIDNGNVGTTGYGVYTGDIYNNGNIVIRTRYSRYTSGTIDGTYKVEVYLLDPAGGVSLFA